LNREEANCPLFEVAIVFLALFWTKGGSNSDGNRPNLGNAIKVGMIAPSNFDGDGLDFVGQFWDANRLWSSPEGVLFDRKLGDAACLSLAIIGSIVAVA
jgi:hypothetical protein